MVITKFNTGQAAKTTTGVSVAMILIGITITPVLLASSALGSRMPLDQAWAAILLGSAILSGLAVITLAIGSRAKLDTYNLVKFPFGSNGSVIINLLLGIGKFGWLVANANMFAHAAQQLLLLVEINLPIPVLVTVGCAVSVLSTWCGIQVLTKIARLAVPVIMLTIFSIVYLALSHQAPFPVVTTQLSFGVATSSVVGTIVVLVTLCPDFGCRLRNYWQACLAAIITYACVYPVLYYAGAIPSSMTGQATLTGAMALLGYAFPAALLVLFATATANTANIYQVTLVTTTLLPQVKRWKIILGIGIVTAVISSFDVMSIFFSFLVVLGIATPPVAGIYLADFLLYRRNGYQVSHLRTEPKLKPLAFAAWGAGVLVAGLTANDFFFITQIPSIDAIITASGCYFCLSFCCSRRG